MVEKQSALVPKRNVRSLGCAATAMSIVRMSARISANGVKSLAISVMNNLREKCSSTRHPQILSSGLCMPMVVLAASSNCL